jgi:hypothetical protein
MISDLDKFCRTEYGCDGKQSSLCDIYVLTAVLLKIFSCWDVTLG